MTFGHYGSLGRGKFILKKGDDSNSNGDDSNSNEDQEQRESKKVIVNTERCPRDKKQYQPVEVKRWK